MISIRQTGADLGNLCGGPCADWNSVPSCGLILGDQPSAQSWPMTAATFILIHKQPQDPVAVEAFFAWAYSRAANVRDRFHAMHPVVGQST
jgi:hypothetical protein